MGLLLSTARQRWAGLPRESWSEDAEGGRRYVFGGPATRGFGGSGVSDRKRFFDYLSPSNRAIWPDSCFVGPCLPSLPNRARRRGLFPRPLREDRAPIASPPARHVPRPGPPGSVGGRTSARPGRPTGMLRTPIAWGMGRLGEVRACSKGFLAVRRPRSRPWELSKKPAARRHRLVREVFGRFSDAAVLRSGSERGGGLYLGDREDRLAGGRAHTPSLFFLACASAERKRSFRENSFLR